MKRKSMMFMLVCLTGTAILVACGQKSPKSYDDYRAYVNSRIDSADRYYDREWADLEREYEMKRAAVENDAQKLDEKTDAEYRKLNEKWDSFKASYTEHRTRTKMEKLRGGLLPADVKGDFSNVGGDRLLAVYTHFVDYVEANRESFDREQWDEIKIVWERLDAHKNEVEKDLPKGDNMKIAAQKLRFNGARMFERGAEKAKENTDAKE
jgi:hypothetical protein